MFEVLAMHRAERNKRTYVTAQFYTSYMYFETDRQRDIVHLKWSLLRVRERERERERESLFAKYMT